MKMIYLAGFLIAIHLALISYINSSLLKQFVDDNFLNTLYIIGSVFSIIFLFSTPELLRKYGSVSVFSLLLVAEIISVFGMGTLKNPIFIIAFFILHTALSSALYLCLDINTEQEIKTESTTGSKRATLLTFANIAWALSPLIFSFLIIQNNFTNVYILSGLFLIPLLLMIILFFKNTDKSKIEESNIILAIKSLSKRKDERRIVLIQFVLNFFYSWMVIYLPLLLNKEIDFGWDKIGIIFTIMLLPFLIFQLPAGFLADKKFGEKEILILGLVIMFVSTFSIPLVKSQILWLWALILFITRIGASLVEISSESYFFKHVREKDTGLISLFRAVRPLSYVAAPLIAMTVVHFFSYSTSFYFLAFFVILGLLFIPKVDTK